MVFANAGISENPPLSENFELDDNGLPLEPQYPVLDVNFRAVLNVIKLSWSIMKTSQQGGSIVLTSSATAYAPEHLLLVYSSVKLTVRTYLRSVCYLVASGD